MTTITTYIAYHNDFLANVKAAEETGKEGIKPLSRDSAEEFVDLGISDTYGEDHLEFYKNANDIHENLDNLIDLVRYAIPAGEAYGYTVEYNPASGGSQYLRFVKYKAPSSFPVDYVDYFVVRVADHGYGVNFCPENDLDYDTSFLPDYWVKVALMPRLQKEKAANSADGMNSELDE